MYTFCTQKQVKLYVAFKIWFHLFRRFKWLQGSKQHLGFTSQVQKLLARSTRLHISKAILYNNKSIITTEKSHNFCYFCYKQEKSMSTIDIKQTVYKLRFPIADQLSELGS